MPQTHCLGRKSIPGRVWLPNPHTLVVSECLFCSCSRYSSLTSPRTNSCLFKNSICCWTDSLFESSPKQRNKQRERAEDTKPAKGQQAGKQLATKGWPTVYSTVASGDGQGQQRWTEMHFKTVCLQRGRSANAPCQNWLPTGHLQEMGTYTTPQQGC